MKNKMRKTIFFLIGLIALSCTKEEQNSLVNDKIDIVSDRLSFKDMQEFNETYSSLAYIDTKEELLYWANSKNHSTLLDSSDSLIVNYSDALKTLLNKDSEFELGDSIIRLSNGNLYASPKDVYSKDKQREGNIIGKITLQNINESNTRAVNIGLNGINARNQKEFNQKYYQPCGGASRTLSGLRKYIHEIYSERISYGGPVVRTRLFLRIKLEYKGSSGWKPASEQRDISYNISGTAYLYPSGAGNPFNLTNNLDCFSGNKDVLISDIIGSYPYEPTWTVSMTGTIYQHIKGDISSNAWSNNGDLW